MDWRGSDFSGARLDEGRFIDCDFSGSRFDGTNLAWGVFDRCRFDGVSARGVDLKGVLIRGPVGGLRWFPSPLQPVA